MKFLFFLAFSMLFNHNYHVSNALIHHNSENHTLEITVKIFVDDLKYLEEKLSEENDNKVFVFNTDEYIKKAFKITLNNDPVDLKPIGQEVENELIFCYYEVAQAFEINSMEIENTILFELYDDQVNMIDVELLNENQRFLLNDEKSRVEVK